MCTHLPCPFSVIFLVKAVYNTCKTIASVRYYVCQREGNGPAGVGAPRSSAHREDEELWTPKSLAYSVHAKSIRITTLTPARTGRSSLPTPSSTKPWARKSSVWKWCRAAAARIADSPTRISRTTTKTTRVGASRPLKCPWPRFSYPTSSVALRFAPLKRCAGASVVRSCPSPVGWAYSFP